MKLRYFKIFAIDSVMIAGIYFGGYLDVSMAKNIVMFMMWLTIIISILLILFIENKEIFKKAENTKTINTINTTFSILQVLALVAVGWWLTAIFLTFITIVLRAKKEVYFQGLEGEKSD